MTPGRGRRFLIAVGAGLGGWALQLAFYVWFVVPRLAESSGPILLWLCPVIWALGALALGALAPDRAALLVACASCSLTRRGFEALIVAGRLPGFYKSTVLHDPLSFWTWGLALELVFGWLLLGLTGAAIAKRFRPPSGLGAP